MEKYIVRSLYVDDEKIENVINEFISYGYTLHSMNTYYTSLAIGATPKVILVFKTNQ